MTSSRCEDRQEAITALVLGVIDSPHATDLLEHLDVCGECMALYEELAQEEAFLQSTWTKMRISAKPPVSSYLQPAHVPGNGSIAAASKPHKSASWSRRWRHLPSLAIAALLVLAATGLFSWFNLSSVSSGTAFGAVMQRIGSARSVTYTMTIQLEGMPPTVRQEMAIDQGLFRSVNARGTVQVLDFANNREIRINPKNKTAVLMRKSWHEKRTLTSYLGWLEPIHEMEGTCIGQADLDGVKTNVFSISKPFQQITIWTDIQTDLPVRVEAVEMPCLDKDIPIPKMTLALDEFRNVGDPAAEPTTAPDSTAESWVIELFAPGVRCEKSTTTFTNFAWNTPVDESLLQVAAPEGYQVIETDDGDPPQEEHALLAALRFWAGASQGSFPADINMLLDSKPLLIREFSSIAVPEQAYAEAVKMARDVVTGSLFSQRLKVADNWNYAGRDVKLGEADKPLCWWKTKDQATCRVIYGDLSMRDVPATDPSILDKP